MKELNFNVPIKELDGKPIPGSNLAQAIAKHLSRSRSENPAKTISICIRLHDKGILELDETDTAYLKILIQGENGLNDLAVSQALEILNK